MQAAVKLASKASLLGEIPVGAVVVDPKSDEIISKAHNQTRIKKDPTAHAEMLAIRKAAAKLGLERLAGLDIYVSLEPCPMCAQAISAARFRRLYFGAHDEKMGGTVNGAKVFHATSCHHKPEIYGGIMEEDSARILKEFFKNKR